MIQSIACTALALACAGTAHAQTPPAPGPAGYVPPKQTLYADGNGGRFLLGGDWLFRADAGDQGVALGFKDQLDSAGWSTVQVPNVFNANQFDVPTYLGSVGWYRKDFVVPPGQGGKGVSWAFRFESANHRATVFLNGRQVGRHVGPYIPFEVPAEGISATGVNRLVVRVDNRRGAADIPPGGLLGNGATRGGWWNYGGLNREVYLRRIDRVDIANAFARPQIACRSCEAKVTVSATLRNPGSGKQSVRVRGRLGGRSFGFDDKAIGIAGRSSKRVERVVTLRNPKLWEPGSPNLYKFSVAVSRGGKRIAVYDANVGMRSIRVNSAGRMLLNGRKVSLRGASMHEDVPDRGSALTTADMDFNVALLRELGATITRAHYPLHPRTIEALDRAGILLWEQMPFWRVPTKSLASGSVRARGIAYLRDAIRRDRNHASVFLWSVGNELPSKITPGQRRYLTDASDAARQEDPSRLVAIDFTGHPNLPPESIYRRFDALGRELVLRLVPRPERADLGPVADRPLPRPTPFLLPGPGAVRDRVRRRGEPRGLAVREGHARLPAELPQVKPRDLRDAELPQRGRDVDPARLPGAARVGRRQPAAVAADQLQGRRHARRPAQAGVRRRAGDLPRHAGAALAATGRQGAASRYTAPPNETA